MKNKKSLVDNLSIRLTEEVIAAKLEPDKEPKPKKRPYTVSEKVIEVQRKKATELLKPFQWKKGQSGNPHGRPPNPVSLTAILNRKLAEHPEDAEKIVDALINLGIGKDMKAIEMNFERIDGKVVERHQIEGELPVRLVFMPAEQLLGGTKVEEISSAPEPLMLEEKKG